MLELLESLTKTNADGNSVFKVRLSLEFSGETPDIIEYPVPNCRLHDAEFEVRIFHLIQRQPFGIKVEEAREYLNEFGGVRVYDAGFHLPFYGLAESDWLGIELDHSHRLSNSKLLPQEFQVPSGLEYLPTNSRLLGVVHVNTSQERNKTKFAKENEEECLSISVTRDRLLDNLAFQNLRYIIRYALDFYAMREARRGWDRTQSQQAIEPIKEKAERIDQVLKNYQSEMPLPVFVTLQDRIREVIRATESDAEIRARQVGLLGALATAGITALAYEHEVNKQFQLLDEVIKKVRTIRAFDTNSTYTLNEIAEQLSRWVERARATRALFSPLLDEEN